MRRHGACRTATREATHRVVGVRRHAERGQHRLDRLARRPGCGGPASPRTRWRRRRRGRARRGRGSARGEPRHALVGGPFQVLAAGRCRSGQERQGRGRCALPAARRRSRQVRSRAPRTRTLRPAGRSPPVPAGQVKSAKDADAAPFQPLAIGPCPPVETTTIRPAACRGEILLVVACTPRQAALSRVKDGERIGIVRGPRQAEGDGRRLATPLLPSRSDAHRRRRSADTQSGRRQAETTAAALSPPYAAR